MKTRYLAAFAFAGLIGAGACAADEENVQFDEAPAFEEAPVVAPVTPAPMPADTLITTPEADSVIEAIDSAAAAEGDVL